jgi:hypothetical protein
MRKLLGGLLDISHEMLFVALRKPVRGSAPFNEVDLGHHESDETSHRHCSPPA